MSKNIIDDAWEPGYSMREMGKKLEWGNWGETLLDWIRSIDYLI